MQHDNVIMGDFEFLISRTIITDIMPQHNSHVNYWYNHLDEQYNNNNCGAIWD